MKQWAILGVLLLAAALRILGAGHFPVWTDEGWSIWAASDPTQVIGLVAADRHPPLYFAALSLWRLAAGDSHLALRCLSIAGGLITVAAVYRIGADWFGRRAGVLAALLLAALPTAVYYGQEVRHYGWLAALTALSWLVLLRYLRRPGRALWLTYVLSAAALLYTLYFGVFTLAAQGVVVLLTSPRLTFGGLPLSIPWRGGNKWGAITIWLRSKLALVGAWAAAGVLYLPWLYVIVTQQADILSSGISGFPGTISAANGLAVLQNVFGAQMLIPLVGFAVGAWAILRRPSSGRVGVLIGGGGLLLALFLLSLKFDFLAARTLAFTTPLLMVACGYGLSRVDGWGGERAHSRAPLRPPLERAESRPMSLPLRNVWTMKGRHTGLPLRNVWTMKGRHTGLPLRGVGSALAGIWVILTLALPVEIQPRLDSGAAARALAAAYEPGDAVILEAGWDDNAFAYEIGQALPDGASITRTLPWTNDRTGGAAVVPQIEALLRAHERVWVVQWLQAPQVLPYLEGGGEGFTPGQALDVPAGDYGARFGAPTIAVRLFTKR